jgi:hypothetical protein
MVTLAAFRPHNSAHAATETHNDEQYFSRSIGKWTHGCQAVCRRPRMLQCRQPVRVPGFRTKRHSLLSR